jgi:hypothetical protein
MPHEITIEKIHISGRMRYIAWWEQDYCEPISRPVVFASSTVSNVDDHYIVKLGYAPPEIARKCDYVWEDAEMIIGVKHDRTEADNSAYSLLLEKINERDAKRDYTILTDMVKG